MNDLRLSASAIEAFKACPARFLLRYERGLQPEKEKDSFRIGTNWHRCHEILHMKPKTNCPDCLRREEVWPDCYLCDGTGVLPVEMMDAVIRFLNHTYAVAPEYKTRDEWETERTKILYSVSAYYWHYGWEDEFETVDVETWFDLPIVDPATGKNLPKARMVGKVDRLARYKSSGLVYVFERKSTSKNLTDSTYWDRLRTDDQITTYLYHLRMAQQLGQLEKIGIMADDPPIHGTFYDVWHKPGINPKKLSQGDSKKFVESGEYCGQEFEIEFDAVGGSNADGAILTVNAVSAASSPGKKEGTFSIFETPEMYGARLLQDISQQPEAYFAQREIARTDKQLVEYQRNLANLVKLIRYVQEHELWYCCDRMCESPFRCDFLPVRNVVGCLNVGGDEVPDGFKKRKRGG